MIIEKLELKNYRNYENLLIDFNPKNNIIIGDNAQGKTNILEAIYFLSLTKSFLGVNEKKLININSNFTSLKGIINKNNATKKLELFLTNQGKKVKINNKEIKKLSEYVSNIKIIIFSPDNLRLLKDSPSVRRKFLNIEISQLSSKYIKILNNYNNVLRQRNEYLKEYKIDKNYLNILNEKLADLAIYIYNKRKKFIEDINKNINNIFKEITNTEQLEVEYISNINYDENDKIMKNKFLKQLEENFEKEKKYNLTLFGTHRDDFIIKLNGNDISTFGSQAQLRLSILSLKLSEIYIFKEELKENPILLLDDIFSELDINKRNNLIKFISNDIQTILTTTDLNMINTEILKNANIYKISGGKIVEYNRKDEKNGKQ